jgi:hypothetical protein
MAPERVDSSIQPHAVHRKKVIVKETERALVRGRPGRHEWQRRRRLYGLRVFIILRQNSVVGGLFYFVPVEWLPTTRRTAAAYNAPPGRSQSECVEQDFFPRWWIWHQGPKNASAIRTRSIKANSSTGGVHSPADSVGELISAVFPSN